MARPPRHLASPVASDTACGLASTLVLAVALATTGCATVKPSQRRHLSKREMDPAADQHEEVFHSHIEAAREAALGGHGNAGGGCGCG